MTIAAGDAGGDYFGDDFTDLYSDEDEWPYADQYGDQYPLTSGGGGGGGGGGTTGGTIPPFPSPPPSVQPPVPGRWRFLYGPAAPAGGFTGNVGQAQNRTVTLRSEPGDQHECSFDLDGANSPAAARITELETDITVMFGTEYIFQGRVGPSQDTLDASAHVVTFTAYDYREVLRRRYLFATDTQMSAGGSVSPVVWSGPQSVIAWDLLAAVQAHPGGNLGISRGSGQGSGKVRNMKFAAADFAGEQISNIAGLADGFDWQVNPYGPSDLRLDIFTPEQGVNRGVVLAHGQGRVAQITRNVDPSVYGNSVFVTGDSNAGGTVSLLPSRLDEAGIASDPAGRWDLVYGTHLKDQVSVNDRAAQLLTTSQVLTPSYTVELQPGTWGGMDDIWLGDTVTVRIKSGRLNVNDQLRVVEMAFVIDSDNNEQLTLTIGRIPLRFRKVIPDMLKRLRYLDTR